MLILRYAPDIILHYECSPISKFDKKLEHLTNEMFDAMYEFNGVGLAAPQIGHSLQVFVYDDRQGNSGAIVNPQLSLLKKGPVQVITETEGCLSLPSVDLQIPRYNPMCVKGWNIFGEKLSFLARDLLARIMQHEYDHLQGILITEVLETWQNMV